MPHVSESTYGLSNQDGSIYLVNFIFLSYFLKSNEKIARGFQVFVNVTNGRNNNVINILLLSANQTFLLPVMVCVFSLVIQNIAHTFNLT